MRTLDAHRNFGIIRPERQGCLEMNQLREATLDSALKAADHSMPDRTRNDVSIMKSFFLRLVCSTLVLAFSGILASADDVTAGDLVVTQAWSRATPGGAKVGGGYLTIENKGSAPDRLVGVASEASAKAEIHEMTMKGGVMTMRAVDGGLTIEPGKTVKLAPGGYHLMLTELKSSLKQGDKLPVTLEFEKAGKVKVMLDVLGVGAQGPTPTMDMKKAPEHSGMKM